MLFHFPALLPAVNPETGRHTTPYVQLFTNITGLLNKGYPPSQNNPQGIAVAQSVTIATAKLTLGGTEGSLTFTNGILTAQVPAT